MSNENENERPEKYGSLIRFEKKNGGDELEIVGIMMPIVFPRSLA